MEKFLLISALDFAVLTLSVTRDNMKAMKPFEMPFNVFDNEGDEMQLFKVFNNVSETFELRDYAYVYDACSSFRVGYIPNESGDMVYIADENCTSSEILSEVSFIENIKANELAIFDFDGNLYRKAAASEYDYLYYENRELLNIKGNIKLYDAYDFKLYYGDVYISQELAPFGRDIEECVRFDGKVFSKFFNH